MVPLFKNKGNIQNCVIICRGIKFKGHTMKLWQRVIELRLRKETGVSEFGFIHRRLTNEAIHLLRVLLERYRSIFI